MVNSMLLVVNNITKYGLINITTTADISHLFSIHLCLSLIHIQMCIRDRAMHKDKIHADYYQKLTHAVFHNTSALVDTEKGAQT